MTYPRDDHAELLDTPEKRRRYLMEWQRTCDDIMAKASAIVVRAANDRAPWPLWRSWRRWPCASSRLLLRGRQIG